MRPLNTLTLYAAIAYHNLAYLQFKRPDDAIFPVVKSNAYGHGLKEVSSILASTSVPYLCIDSFPEYQIVKAYARKKSLVLGETFPDNYRAYDPRWATFGVYNLSTIRALLSIGRSQSIHLFINTGMHREGIDLYQLPEILSLLEHQSLLTIEWVMSHLSDADSTQPRFVDAQHALFAKAVTMIRAAGHNPQYYHIGNSWWRAGLESSLCNAWRPWLAFYGYDPLWREDSPLRPWLDFHSTVISCHSLETGMSIGYNGTFTTSEPSYSITIPAWYKEWIPRHAQEFHHLVWDWTPLPCAGRISMNLSTYISPRAVPLYAPVTIYDHNACNRKSPCSLAGLADRMGTIPYTLLVALDPTIHRTVLTHSMF
jgi:alanine racemase